MKLINVYFVLSTALLLQGRVLSQPSEPYAYGIYYGGGSCSDHPTVIRGYASDQAYKQVGYAATSRSGPGEDLCSLESVCMINSTSTECMTNQFLTEGQAMISITDDGLVMECDETNSDAECSFLDRCYSSSLYPSCNFQIVTTSRLVESPQMIQYTKPTSDSGLDMSSYLIFYSDAACTSLEGIEGVLNNEPNTMAATDESVSCREAMACAFHPEEGELGRVCQNLLGVDVPPTVEMTMGPVVGGFATPCSEDGVCEPVSPYMCEQSTLHPSCFFRVVTASTLFANPGEYLTSYELEKENQEEGASTVKLNSNQEYMPTYSASRGNTVEFVAATSIAIIPALLSAL